MREQQIPFAVDLVIYSMKIKFPFCLVTHIAFLAIGQSNKIPCFCPDQSLIFRKISLVYVLLNRIININPLN